MMKVSGTPNELSLEFTGMSQAIQMGAEPTVESSEEQGRSLQDGRLEPRNGSGRAQAK